MNMGEFLAKNGGKSNAFTQEDKTTYFFNNAFLNASYRVNLNYLRTLIRDPYREPKDIINYYIAGNSITIEDLIKYKNAIFKSSKIKWLVQGNVKKEEVIELV